MMKVDVTAMLQGVSDAYDKGEIGKEFYTALCQKVHGISYRGSVGRRVCDYNKLMSCLGEVEPEHWVQLTMLWKRLGESLASGICVAGDE